MGGSGSSGRLQGGGSTAAGGEEDGLAAAGLHSERFAERRQGKCGRTLGTRYDTPTSAKPSPEKKIGWCRIFGRQWGRMGFWRL